MKEDDYWIQSFCWIQSSNSCTSQVVSELMIGEILVTNSKVIKPVINRSLTCAIKST